MEGLEKYSSLELLAEYIKRELYCDNELAKEIAYEIYPRLDEMIFDR